MNEIDILSAYISKPRQMKKVKGVMTPVYLKPYDKNYNYTKRFIKFNNILLKQGLTNTIIYDDKLIYDRRDNSFVNRSKFYKKKKLKENKPYLLFEDDVVLVNPAIVDLNNEGVLYTYGQDFRQAPSQPYHTTIYKFKQILRQYRGNRILIKTTWLDNPHKETTLDIPADNKEFNKWFTEEKIWLILEWASGEYIFDYDPNHDPENGDLVPTHLQARMRIWIINNVDPIVYAQAFADSVVNHCVLNPVREYLEFRIDKAKNKETSTIKKYNAAMNKLINWEFKYPVGKGIPIDKLHQFCGDTGFGIDLYLPDASCSGRQWKSYRPPKQPTKIFKFINTRHNHLDITAQVDNNFRQKITQEEYDTLLTEFHNGDEYYVYNKYSIISQKKIYQVESEYNDIVKDFEKDNKLKRYRLDDTNPKQELLIQFVKASCVYNGCVDFKDTFIYREPDIQCENDIYKLEQYYGNKLYGLWDQLNCAEKWYKVYTKNIQKDKVKQIDMSKAYTRCNDSPCFEGYLGKITDFRNTTKIRGLGLYVIKNIKNLPAHLIALGCYFEWNIYPSPELKYLKKLGVKYDIVAGCWGTKININWGKEKDEDGEYTGMYKKSEKVRNYVKWFGCALKTTNYTTYQYRTGNIDYIKNWKYESEFGDDNVEIKYIQDSYGVPADRKYTVMMNVPKQNVYHHSHICSFIYSYQRIMMIEQLLKIPYENIIRVCVDGIYYNECDFEICKNFEVDKSIKLGNIAGENYRTNNYEWRYNLCNLGEDKIFNRKEVWTGAGGCGKTYDNIKDKGNCDIVYIAHSWKLAAAKRDEFNCDVSVVQRLTMDDWFVDGKVKNYWEDIANKYSTLIIDEISTLSNKNKIIIEKRFPKHKLIYCGDIGYYKGKVITYQCPPIFKIEDDTLFQFGKGYKHYHLDTNRRCECPKLLKLLGIMRKIIENYAYRNFGELQKWCEKNFDIIGRNDFKYRPCDMILSRTHKVNEFYDDKYKDAAKYYVMEKHYKLSTNTGGVLIGDENIYNGQIFLTKPDIPEFKYRNRHGYTIDCIQGETAYNKLIIDINGLNSWQHLYTAISRGKWFEQLVFVK